MLKCFQTFALWVRVNWFETSFRGGAGNVNALWLLGTLRWLINCLCVDICVLTSLEILSALLSSCVSGQWQVCCCTWRVSASSTWIIRSRRLWWSSSRAVQWQPALCSLPATTHEASLCPCLDLDVCLLCYFLFLFDSSTGEDGADLTEHPNGSMTERKFGYASFHALTWASNSYHSECFFCARDCAKIFWSTLSSSMFTTSLLYRVENWNSARLNKLPRRWCWTWIWI